MRVEGRFRLRMSASPIIVLGNDYCRAKLQGLCRHSCFQLIETA